jgi:pimeloyl-ACP methyl ester carboxylesterase
LPGLLAGGRSFDALGLALSPAWRVLAVDLRGRGRSSGPRYGHGYHLQVADTLSFLDQFGFPRVVLAGHSFGAMVASLVAAWYPERVAGLVLLDGGSEVAPSVLATMARIARGLDATYPSLHAYLARMRQVGAFQPWQPEFEPFLSTSVEAVPGGVRPLARRAAVEQELRAYADGPPLYQRIHAALRCPTLVVCAEHGFGNDDPPVVSDAAYRAMLERIPAAHGVRLPGTNHYTVLIGRAAATVEAVAAFLDSLGD